MSDTMRSGVVRVKIKVDQEQLKEANKIISDMSNDHGSLTKKFKKISDNFKKVTDQVEDFSKNYKNVVKDINHSTKEMRDGTNSATKEMSNNYKALTRDTKKLGEQHKKYADTYESGSRKIQESNRRIDQSSDESKRHISSLSSTADRFISVGKSMSLVSLGLGASFISGAKKSVQLQNEFIKIRNLATTSGESFAHAQKNVNEMQKQGQNLSIQYGVSQDKISKGYEELVRRGYSTNQVLGTQKEFLQASMASGDDYTDVVNSAASAIESFGLKTNNTNKMASNTKEVLNQMSYAADLTATNFQGMGDAMKYVGATAHQANQSVAETTSAIGILSNNGLDSSQAGTGMRQIYSRLVAPRKQGQGVLKQLGLTTKDFQDVKGNLLPIQDIFSKLNDKMKNMSSTQRGAVFNALFGQTGQNAAIILSKNVTQLKHLNEQVSKSQNQDHGKGYIAILSDKNKQTAQNRIKQANQALQALKITFANELLPTFTKVAGATATWINKLSKAPSWLKKIVAFGTLFIAAISPVTLVVGGLMKAFNGVKSAIIAVRNFMNKPLPSTATDSAMEQEQALNKSNSITGDYSFDFPSENGKEKIGSRAEMNYYKNHRFKAFTSRLHGLKKTGTRFGKVGLNPSELEMSKGISGMSRISRFEKMERGLGILSTKIPYLDIAMAGTQLIGMKRQNVGKKIGSAGGMLAGTMGGAALGSAIPGLGTVIGGAIGGTVGGIAGTKGGKWLGDKIQKSLPNIRKLFPKNAFKPFTSDWKSTKKTFGSVKKTIGGTFKSIKKSFKPVTSGWKYMMRTFNSKQGQNNIKTLGKVFKWLYTNVAKPIFKHISTVFKIAMIAIRATAKGIGTFLKTWFKGAFKVIGNIFKSFADIFTGNWKGLGKDLKGIVIGIVDMIKAPFKSLGAFFGSVWKDVKGSFVKGLDSIIDFLNGGIKGINHLLSYVGGSGHTIPTIKFATGTSSNKKIDRNTHVMLNDGFDSPETGNKELVALPNGKIFIPQKRRWTGWLPAGSEVLNARDTRNLMYSKGIKHFAGGTSWWDKTKSFAGHAWNDTKHFASSAWKATKHVASNAEEVIAHPVKAVMNMFSGFTSHVSPFISDLGTGIIDKAKDLIASWFKKKVGSESNPAGSGVQRWKPDVVKALGMLGLSTSGAMVQKVLRQIQTESGGNPNAVGGTDGLSDGRAMGLMQVKPGTFSAYGKSSLGGWNNGFASLYAGLNYAKHRYGSDLSFLGQGHGYANGGWSNKPAIFGEYPGQPEVVINPARKSADRLIGQAIMARAKADITSPFASLVESKKSKAQRTKQHMLLNRLYARNNRRPVMPSVSMNVNITVNGNADKSNLNDATNKFRRIVREELQKIAFNQLQKI